MCFLCLPPTDKLGIIDMTNGGIIFPPNIPNNAAIHAYLTISDQLSVKTFLVNIPNKSVSNFLDAIASAITYPGQWVGNVFRFWR